MRGGQHRREDVECVIVLVPFSFAKTLTATPRMRHAANPRWPCSQLSIGQPRGTVACGVGVYMYQVWVEGDVIVALEG